MIEIEMLSELIEKLRTTKNKLQYSTLYEEILMISKYNCFIIYLKEKEITELYWKGTLIISTFMLKYTLPKKEAELINSLNEKEFYKFYNRVIH